MRRSGSTYNYRFDGQGNSRALADDTGRATDFAKFDECGPRMQWSGLDLKKLVRNFADHQAILDALKKKDIALLRKRDNKICKGIPMPKSKSDI